MRWAQWDEICVAGRNTPTTQTTRMNVRAEVDNARFPQDPSTTAPSDTEHDPAGGFPLRLRGNPPNSKARDIKPS